MSRVRIVLVIAMSLLVGGVVLADPWGAPTPPTTPPPPGPVRGPKPPKAPKPPRINVSAGGLSISVRNGKIHIDGLDQLVAGHLQSVRDMLANHPNLPKDVRDKITARMDRVKAIVDKNIKSLDTSDLDKLEQQVEKMGDELEKALEGLDEDLDKLGDKWGKDLAKDIQKGLKDMKDLKIGPDPAPPADPADDDDNDTDDDNLPNASTDPSTDDVNAAVDSLKNFALKPAQKDAIAKLRVDTDKLVELERARLEVASKELEMALGDVNVQAAVIERAVDKVTAHEAAIRKARLLTWVQARNLLDPDQRKQLEAAAHHVK